MLGMLQQSPVMAFVATNDGERAKPFYSDTLGLSLQEDTPFALVYEVRGTTIRVSRLFYNAPARAPKSRRIPLLKASQTLIPAFMIPSP